MTEVSGIRQRQVFTTQLKARQNVILNATPITIGIHRAKPALPRPSRGTVHRNLQIQFGMTTARTANLPKPGAAQAGVLQVTLQLTAQVPESADTPAQVVTLGTGVPVQNQRSPNAAQLHQLRAGIHQAVSSGQREHQAR